jgi:ArsR family transcriptional regulator
MRKHSQIPPPAAPKAYPLDRLFQALADRTRLRVLHLVSRQEVCVCNFVGILQAPQPKISRHLAYLRKAGLVATRREGKWMHYRLEKIADPAAATVLKTTLQSLAKDEFMQQDLARLERACCGLDSLVQLSGDQLRRARSIRDTRERLARESLIS